MIIDALLLHTVRQPLGKMIKRPVKASKEHKTLPGAPDGKYLVIQYLTNFKNKKSAVETQTIVLEEKGKWRTVGYFIK